MQWGLIPFWVKSYESSLAIREKTLNSRSETIFDKPIFRHSIQAERCLVLVDGFYEWRHVNNKAFPYYIRLKGHQPFALAGIWDSWTNPETKGIVKTYSVITTKANPLLDKIHNTKKRMPVILPANREKYWLEKLDEDAIQAMLNPYNQEEMEAYPVSRTVIKLGFNTSNPEVTQRQEYQDLPEIYLA